jgi:RNA polymerase sigma-70 factor (ECF subfamily)
MESLDSKTCKEKRLEKNNFLKEITDYRDDLFRYCRKLTNNPWDEYLVQETLVVAYGRLSDKHSGINNLKSYLFKMATNQWIDWCRRSRVQFDSTLVPDEPYYMGNVYEVKETLSSLVYFLPPKERVALVLSEAFESKNDEIAEILGTTEGAVKSALNRSRTKLKSISETKPFDNAYPKNAEQDKIVSLAVDAFNRRDLEGFSKLFVSNAIGYAPGCFFETSLEEIKKGSLFHTINSHDGSPLPLNFKAEMVKLNGDTLFILYNGDILDDVWKFTIDDDKIEKFDCYYCCPNVLMEIANLLSKKTNNHGYYYEQNLN